MLQKRINFTMQEQLEFVHWDITAKKQLHVQWDVLVGTIQTKKDHQNVWTANLDFTVGTKANLLNHHLAQQVKY